MNDTATELDLESLLGDSPPEDCAHIVKRSGNLGAGALVTAAAEAGLEVEALCGYRWVPRGIAADDKTPCAACVREWEAMGGQL